MKLEKSVKSATLAAYQSDLNQYQKWVDDRRIEQTLPHQSTVVAEYVLFLDESDKSLSTIKRHVQAISWLHRLNGCADYNPIKTQLVRSTLQGVINDRIEQGRPTAATSKKPARVNVIRAMLAHCDPLTVIGSRDRALLLVGFAGALRRSELVALQVSDIFITDEGADIRIRSSKTDKTGRGEVVSIVRGHGATCPVLALVQWYEKSGITSGPVFRRVLRGEKIQEQAISCRTVANKIKRFCRLSGLDPSEFSGHSLRSGMLTSAAEKGADLIPLAQHARHINESQTMHYIRQANRFKNNPTRGLL